MGRLAVCLIVLGVVFSSTLAVCDDEVDNAVEIGRTEAEVEATKAKLERIREESEAGKDGGYSSQDAENDDWDYGIDD